jgi:predicted MPP superfamily phosphohydrolase
LLGIFSLVLGLMLFKDLAWLVLVGVDKLVARASGGDVLPKDPERRRLFERALNGAVLTAAGALGAVGLSQARQAAEVIRVTLAIPELPEALIGLRIAQVSDIHVGPTIRKERTAEIAQAVNALSPDLIAVTGDLVDGVVTGIGEHVAPLGEMKAPLGVFFVTGNHEYYSGVDEWLDFVRSLGWRTLTNEHVTLTKDGATLVVAGTPDRSSSRLKPEHVEDLDAALAGAPEAAVRILLAHQPRTAYKAVERGFDLMLSGHTHGGQYFPYTLLIHLAQPFSAGAHLVEGMWLYVNRGTTYWGPPIRLGSPQEITLIELARA